MGAVQSRLVINDGMTPALRRINNAMKLMIDNFEAVQRASGRSINTSNLSAAKQEIGKANALLDEMEQQYRELNQQQDSLNKSLSTGTSNAGGLLNKIKGMVGAYAGVQGLQALVGLSDELTSQSARLELIVDDGGSVEALEQKIFASAQSARASYTDTMATVAKLGLTAGDAFGNNDELIKFTELINKNFVIGGASAEEQSAARYQLTQALGSGKLQGDEYRSIIENAPMLAQSIEDYMRNVQGATGSMKDWAAEGLLTADVIKAAVFNSADEVEERFNQMPMTWAQVFTSMKNQAIQALNPLLQKINELANDPNVQNTVNGLINGFAVAANVAAGLFGVICSVYNFMSENWGTIAPIIMGVVTALLLFKAVTIAINAVEAASAAIKGILAAHQMLSTGATLAATAAQYGLNTALLACPITWILIIIIAVIAAIYAVVAAINKATGSTVSATGIIFGAICAVAAAIWNTLLGLINGIIQLVWTVFVEPFLGIIEWVLNVCNGGFNSFGDAVKNLLGNIISWFLSLGKVVTQIIDAIFGTDWTSGLSSLQDEVLSWGKNENAITISREAPTLQSLTGGAVDRWSYTDAWNTGYNAGESLEDRVSGMFNLENTISDAQSSLDAASFGNTLGDIAGDTSDIADSVDKTTEELEYLRDIAEQEAINRFTTAEVKVDMTGMTNRIDSSMDIDGVINQFTAGFVDALSTAAEGVHDDEL